MSRIQEFIALENLADIMMGQSPDSDSCNTDESGLPFLQGCAEFGRQSPFTNIYCFPPLRISKPDSVLMSVRAPVGKMNWGEQNYCIGRGLAAIKAKPNLADTKFLNYSLEQNISFLHRRSQGSTFLAIGANDIKIFPIPAISYEKQRKISSILETIDRTITHTEALIEKYQQIKAGLMHDLFTRGIGADGKLRPTRDQAPELYQESSIGWIPKEWKVETLNNIFGTKNIVNGPFGSDLLTSELKKEGVPVLYCQDIKPGFFERVSYSNVTAIKAAQLSFCNVHKDDILLAKVGSPPCDSCIYDEDVSAIVTQDVIRIRPSARHDSQFFSSWFNSGYGRRAIKKISIEGTRERVSLGDFKKLLVPLPNSLEQKEIGRKISQTQVVIAKEKINLQKLKHQKSGLMHDLLTGTVQVNSEEIAP